MPESNQSSETRSRKRVLRKRRVWIAAIVIPLVLLLAGGAAYAAKLLNTTETVLESSYKEIKRSEPVEKVDPIEEPVSFLFMGIDNDDVRGLGSTRADSIIYATLNPDTHQLDLLSIPRDTYVPIMKDGKQVKMDRINVAYAIGEEDSMVETVEEFLDLPVNYYATLNFHSFLDVIDALGGIEMDVPVDIKEMDSDDNGGAITLKKGLQTLDGEQALALSRTRKIDDDIQRGYRQQLVIQAIIQKATGLGSITKYNDILEEIGSNMKTNMQIKEVKSVLQTGLNEDFTIESHVFGWSSFMDGGRDLVEVTPDSYEEVRSELAETLNLETNTSTTALDSEKKGTTSQINQYSSGENDQELTSDSE